jgi:hypothetical protein
MIDKLMQKSGRKKIIYNNRTPYMVRYYLLRKSNSNKKGFNIFLHKILLSDSDEHLHNHPWDAFTLIMKGAYIEHKEKNSSLFKSFSFRKIRCNDFHKIELVNNKPVWTLFIHGPRKQNWGFLVDNKVVDWRKYLGISRD